MRATLAPLFLAAAVAAITAAAQDLTPKELAAARKIYMAKCAKCHQFYEPTNYTEPDWRRWMEAMARKSKLKPGQETLLNRYLNAYRAGEITLSLRGGVSAERRTPPPDRRAPPTKKMQP